MTVRIRRLHPRNGGALGTRLRRALPVIAVTGAVMSTGATAQTVNCHSFACFNRTVTRLQSKLKRDDHELRVLATCLQEDPVVIFGNRDGSQGYVYNNGTMTFNTTGLDASLSGDPVSAWFLGDRCNRATTAAADASARVFGAFGPIAPQASWPTPELRP